MSIPCSPEILIAIEIEAEFKSNSAFYKTLRAFKNKPGIYKILNSVTGKVYIGASRRLRSRVLNHMGALRKGIHTSKKMQADFNSHGAESFIPQEIEYVDLLSLRGREDHWLQELNACEAGYNNSPKSSIHYEEGYKVPYYYVPIPPAQHKRRVKSAPKPKEENQKL